MATMTAEMPTMEMQPLLLPVAASVPLKMTGLRKAAILFVALGQEAGKLLLKELGPRHVRQLTDEITRLGEVPASVLTQIMSEFYGLLETQQYMVRGGREYALQVLSDAFGDRRARDLLQQVTNIQERTVGDIGMLQEMDPIQLSKFLENELPQTIALVLAHLEPTRGATLLMSLRPQQRTETVKRLAEMRQFSPEMAQKVALVLARRMDTVGDSVRRSYAGFKSVADLLNRIEPGTSKNILEEIEQQEPKLAIGIRDLMFTFDDLQTVPQPGVREIVAAVDKRVLATALKGATENLRAHIFQTMSSRAMQMLRDDMDAMGPLRNKDILLAQQEVLKTARRLESEGRVALRMEVEGEYAA